MHQRSDLIYSYDGSLNGFLCCVFEAFLAKERPVDIIPDERLEPTLFSIKWIATDQTKADRVFSAVEKKLNDDAAYLIQNGLCCCHEHIEMLMLDFLIFAFDHGKYASNALGEKAVSELQKAVLYLKNEAHYYIEFIRFSEYEKGLVSVIEPKNHVLPTIAPHFCDRFPNELFLIYDKTHKSAIIHKPGQWVITDQIEDFIEPEPDKQELFFRELWGTYFEAIAIKERTNPVCQRGHLPIRYRAHMTEFMRQGRTRELFAAMGLEPPKRQSDITELPRLKG